MKRVLVLSFVLALAITTLAFAQGKPDFSGTWTLDPAKSDLGQMRPAGKQAPMRTVTLVIKQTGDTLTIQRSMGKNQEVASYKLDGSESINKLPSGNEARTIMKWSGATLVAKTTAKINSPEGGGMDTEMTDVRSLSSDGKVMTLSVTRKTPRGEVKQTLIYNKQ
jgi:hypothetical protein